MGERSEYGVIIDGAIPSVPYYVYEGEQARHERNLRRILVVLIVTVILLFASNALWLYAWTQYDYVGEEVSTHTVDVDAKDGVANYVGDGVANYVGNDGSIINGADQGYENDDEKTSSEESGQSWDED